VPVDFLLKIIPPTGSPPVCEIVPPEDIVVPVGTPVSFDVIGTDPDVGEVLYMVTAGLPDGATMTPDLPMSGPSGMTSTFTWTPGFEDVGSYVIVYTVTDRSGQQAFAFKNITVVVGQQNQPPTLSINPPGPITVAVDDPVTFTVFGADPDPNDILTLDAVSGMPVDATMTPGLPTSGPSSGVSSVFNWTPTQAGTYTISYQVTDAAGASDSGSITIIVNPQQPPALAIIPPGPLFVQHNAQVGFTVTGTDPDPKDTVTLAVVSGMPAGAAMGPVLPTSGPASGVSSDYGWMPNLLQIGQHVITYSATDKKGNQVTRSITINVVPGPNAPPVLTITPAGPLTVDVGQPVTFNVTGTDTDALDQVTLAVTAGMPAGATMTPNLPTAGPTGISSTFNWTSAQAGTVTIHYTATDLLGAQDADSITIEVIQSNRPPVADAGPDQTIDCAPPSGHAVNLDGTGSSDPDNDPLTYTWTGPFDPLTGATVAVDLPVGQHTVVLTVNDGKGGTDADTMVVTIHPDTTPPVITLHSTPEILSPADHLYRTITIADCVVSVVDACAGPIDLSLVKIIKVSSDEPEDVECEGCPPLVENLTAGQHTVIGNVTIWNDATTLFVQYNVTSSGWTLGRTHVNVSQDAIVVNGKTYTPSSIRPPPGQYTTQKTHNPPVTTYTYTFPLSQWTSGTLYILTHAEASSNGGEFETAYGGNHSNTGSGWWFYSVFEVCHSDDGSGGSSGDDDGHSSGGIFDDDDDVPGSSGDDDDDDGNSSGSKYLKGAHKISKVTLVSSNSIRKNGNKYSIKNNTKRIKRIQDDEDDLSISSGSSGGGSSGGHDDDDDDDGGSGGSSGGGSSGGGSSGGGSSGGGSGGSGDDEDDDGSSGGGSGGSGDDDDDDGSSGGSGGGSGDDEDDDGSSGGSSGGSGDDEDDDGSSGGGSGGGDDDDDDGSSGGGSGGGDDEDDDGSGGGSGGGDDEDDDGSGGGSGDDEDDDGSSGGGACNDPDGNTLNDIVISTDGRSVQVRAERRSDGNGRVYTITMEVADPSGNVTTAECKVFVPNGEVEAIDDGPAAGYTVYYGNGQQIVSGGHHTSSRRPQNDVKLKVNTDDEAESKPAHENIAAKPVVPTVFALKPNYPNPFNPSTTIAYDIPQQAHVTVEVYNLLGQVVVRLVDEFKAPGSYIATWNGRNASGSGVSSGVYIYRIVTSTGFTESRRMTLLK
jgi:hypothetical protein